MSYTWRFDVALQSLPQLLEGLGLTCLLTVLSMATGLVVGLVIAVMRFSRWKAIRLPAYAFTEIFRTTPLLVQVVWVFTVLPLTVGITLSPFFSDWWRWGLTSRPSCQRFTARVSAQSRGAARRRFRARHDASAPCGASFCRRLFAHGAPMAAMRVALFKDTSGARGVGGARALGRVSWRRRRTVRWRSTHWSRWSTSF
jgi:His/Glu/Gln/Arg/opine family amino acid ABC transporter permease subunit